jgi:hypothetical protein
MPQPELWASNISEILAKITIPTILGCAERSWIIGQDGEAFYIQLVFLARDSRYPDSLPIKQRCRKWRVSKYSTKTEVVDTAFKACWMATYHEMKEQFLYQGQPIYSPHFDVDARVEMCQSARFDKRQD